MRFKFWHLFAFVRALLVAGFCLVSWCGASSMTSSALAVAPAEECVVAGVDNLYRVSSELYRSGQPSREGFQHLQKLGLRSVINLREYHSDAQRVIGTSIHPFRYRLAAGSITEMEVEKVLLMIKNAPKPVLIHCWHGSDRTGCIVAAYRIVVQGWTVEQALDELQEPQYGHHSFWYDNIPELLQSIDWDLMRASFKY